jgi:acetoin utilization deacetylase AcuC-like enzyme
MAEFFLVDSASHALHHPPTEFDGGRLLPCRETPDRVESIRQHLLSLGLARAVQSPAGDLPPGLEIAHAPEYLEALQVLSREAASQGSYLYPSLFAIRPEMQSLAALPHGLLARHSMDTGSPVGPGTWLAALGAARAAAHATHIVMGKPGALAYALCRPPGHHAGRDFMGGYCYLNNAALAAIALKAKGRVAVVDVDYHHGNGTQSIFWDDADVFFLSLHGHPRFEYPYYSGLENELGPPGSPTNLNIPLERGTTGRQYLDALQRGLEAVARFSPQSLVVSPGFDAYRRDPWSTFHLEVGDFAHMAARLAQMSIPTVLVQEGGYATPDLPRLAEAFLTRWAAVAAS